MTTGHPPLARSTLDRAAFRRTDERWLVDAWRRARVLVVDVAAGGRTLVEGPAEKPALALLSSDALVGGDAGGGRVPGGDAGGGKVPGGDAGGGRALADGELSGRLFLGVEPDGVPVFAIDAPLPAVPDTRALTLREVGHLLTDRDAGLLTTAVALANWHARHAYSSITGLPTVMGEAGWSRMDESGRQFWPRTDPAMIVLVHDGVPGPDGRCLLGNNASWPDDRGARRFSCLAGYVEPGESAEASVLREVDEEVGLAPHQVEYVASQAWPFPGSLMLGFFATADPDAPLRLDPTEIAHAGWFTRRQIAAAVAGEDVDLGAGLRIGLPPPSSIAFFLITRWLDA